MTEPKDFSSLISGLHNTVHIDEYDEQTNLLIVDNKRQFSTTPDFNTMIAYEGDINSQLITIQCPRKHDNHDLSLCNHKELRWKNMASGIEGISTLNKITPESEAKNFYMQWEVPADACTQAGTLEISVSIYDKESNQIVFSWNTAKYTGLTIGGSLESVGFEFPPKDEILIIDRDTKSIIAPVGYNNTICNYGEIGVAEVYFLVNRYLGKNRGIDLMDVNTSINIYYTYDDNKHVDNDASRIEKRLYTAEINNRNSEGLVLIKWLVPDFITAGTIRPDPLQITLSFYENGKTWYSNTYQNLKVGENIFFDNGIEEEQEGVFEAKIKNIIDDYLSENEFIIDPNQ